MTGRSFLARPDLLGYGALIAEEAAFGADLSDIDGSGWSWTDLTADLRDAEGTSTTIGRQDNVGQAPTARHTCSLNNNPGNYTPGNPTGSNYPNVKQNTPWRQRISRDGGATWKIRFQGYADSIQPRALDASLKTKKVDVTAFGMLGRLDGRKRPLKAPLIRAVSATAPAAWWPMDDGKDSASFLSAVAGNGDMRTVSGTVTAAGAQDFPAGTTAAAELGTTGLIEAGLSIGATTAWSVGFAYRVSATAVGAQRTIAEIPTSSGWRFVITIGDASPGVGNTNVVLWARSADDSTVVALLTSNINTMDGGWHWCQATFETAGSSVKSSLYVDAFSNTSTDISHSIAIGTPIKAFFGWLQDKYAPSTNAGPLALGTIAFWASNVQQPIAGAVDGWTGETVSDRLTRFCGEEGIALDLAGTSTVTMGPQKIATTVAILRDCEATDHGLMYDGLGPGIGYVCRSAMHNAAIGLQIDAATNNQLTPPFEPYFDKQGVTNLWQVTREGGQTVTPEKTDGPVGTDPIVGIGIADAQATINVDSDSVLDAHAGWLLGLTTNEGLRYPALPMNMRQVPQFAANVLALLPGSRVQVSGVRSESTDLPPETLDELLQGWTETTTAATWAIVGNHAPFDPFRIGKVNTMRVQASESTVAAGFNATALSFTVAGSLLWTTRVGMFPMSIMVGGELMTLSSVSGASSPQTFTVSARHTNGIVKSHVTGEKVTVFKPGRVGI